MDAGKAIGCTSRILHVEPVNLPQRQLGVRIMASRAYAALRDTRRLPSPNEAVMNILRVARDLNATIPDLLSVVECDPATAARILKYVNSPLAGVGRKVFTLKEAVILLGMRNVVCLSLGYSLLARHRNGRCDGFNYDAYWSDALARAVTVRHLSARHGLVANESFTCGLLSKIGKLALATVFPEQYSHVLSEVDPYDSDALTRLERGAFELDHYELSAEMMADWNLPDYFCEAVRAQANPKQHGLPPATRACQLARLLHLCEQVSPFFQKESVHKRRLAQLMMIAHDAYLGPEDFTQTFEAISCEWHEAGTLFNIDLEPNLEWDQIYEEACEAAIASGKYPTSRSR